MRLRDRGYRGTGGQGGHRRYKGQGRQGDDDEGGRGDAEITEVGRR